MDWSLFDKDLWHERVKSISNNQILTIFKKGNGASENLKMFFQIIGNKNASQNSLNLKWEFLNSTRKVDQCKGRTLGSFSKITSGLKSSKSINEDNKKFPLVELKLISSWIFPKDKIGGVLFETVRLREEVSRKGIRISLPQTLCYAVNL